MKKEARSLVKELVIASSIVDNNGHSDIADVLIKCANNVKSEAEANAIVKDLIKVTASLREAGYNDEADRILREAGFWSGVADVAKGAWEGVKGVGQQVGNAVKGVGQQVGNAVKNVGTGIKESYQLGNLKGTFADINQKVTKALDYATNLYGSVQDPAKKKKISDLTTMLQNMQTVGSQVYNIVMEDEQAQPAQSAVQSEVQPAAQPPAPAGETTGMGTASTPGVESIPAAASTATTSLQPGAPVKWVSRSGQNEYSGTIVGPDPVKPNLTQVKMPNGQTVSVNPQVFEDYRRYKAAKVFNLRRYIQG